MRDKKGQQMTLTTIIAIVLGIAVLVLLIWGFSTGWTNMWDQVSGRTTSSNVKLRIADCNNDCEKGEYNAWCNEKKSLRFFDASEKTLKVSGTCLQFFKAASNDVTLDGKLLPRNLGFNSCEDASTVCPN